MFWSDDKELSSKVDVIGWNSKKKLLSRINAILSGKTLIPTDIAET